MITKGCLKKSPTYVDLRELPLHTLCRQKIPSKFPPTVVESFPTPHFSTILEFGKILSQLSHRKFELRP